MLARAKTPYPVSAFGGLEYTRREWREVPAGVSQKHLDDYANVLEYQESPAPVEPGTPTESTPAPARKRGKANV